MTAKTIILAQGADGKHHKFAFNTANISSAQEKMETMFPDFKVISYTPESFYYIEPQEEKTNGNTKICGSVLRGRASVPNER